MNLILANDGLGIGAIIGIVVAVVVVVAIVIWVIATYNKLVKRRNHIEDAFSTIDVYLKKRFDLIPNLVETVKGYAKHEHETFTKVTEARAKSMKASTIPEKIEADKAMSSALYGFYRVSEDYPELKANVNFMDLQGQLKTIENELVNARKYFNANVREFNNIVLTFPSLIIAKIFKFEKMSMFEIENPEERNNVKVSF